MRIFIADTSGGFLTQLQRMFRYTPVDHNCYAAVLSLDANRFFDCATTCHTTCLVKPCNNAAKLTLEKCGTAKYKLTCPTATCSNTRVLTKQILRFLQQQDVIIDVVVFPPLGDRTHNTADAMHRAIVDVWISAANQRCTRQVPHV